MSTPRFIITTSEAFVNSVGRVSLSLIFIISDTGSQFRSAFTRLRGHEHATSHFQDGRERTMEWNMTLV